MGKGATISLSGFRASETTVGLMTALFRKPKTWLSVFILAVIGLLLFVPIKKALDVAAVQDAVQRDWEINFNETVGVPTTIPPMLPPRIDSIAEDVFDQFFGDTHGYSNRDIVYKNRFRSLFRGPIRDIVVYDFERFRGDLGAAFARFPSLRRVEVIASYDAFPTEAEWTHFCVRLRELPRLEEIELGGTWITDAAIAPLAGHPNLRTVTITLGSLTDGCTKTFASMPRLSKLHIEDQIHSEDQTAWLSPEQIAAMQAALPSVTVEIP